MRFAILRPEPAASAMATALGRAGHQAIVAPMLRIAHRTPPLDLGGVAALLVTSVNAVAAIAERPELAELVALDTYAVGETTAAALRAAGFSRVYVANGGGKALAELVAQRRAPVDGPLLALVPLEPAIDLAAVLGAMGFTVRTAVVYAAVAVGALPPALAAALDAEALDGLVVASERTACTFVACLDTESRRESAKKLKVFAISAKAAAPLSELGCRQIVISDVPSGKSLLSALVAAR